MAPAEAEAFLAGAPEHVKSLAQTFVDQELDLEAARGRLDAVQKFMLAQGWSGWPPAPKAAPEAQPAQSAPKE